MFLCKSRQVLPNLTLSVHNYVLFKFILDITDIGEDCLSERNLNINKCKFETDFDFGTNPFLTNVGINARAFSV